MVAAKTAKAASKETVAKDGQVADKATVAKDVEVADKATVSKETALQKVNACLAGSVTGAISARA